MINLRPRRLACFLVLLLGLVFLAPALATGPKGNVGPGGGKRGASKAEAYRQRALKAAATRKRNQQLRRDGLRHLAINPTFIKHHQTHYSIKVPGTPVRDQHRSGRCWAYAWTKTLLSMAAQKGVKVDGLSGSFINYHALRTLAHGAIDQARRTNDRPEFNLEYLDAEMVGEGGYSHWANQIVKRHGIVPSDKMRSSFDSRESQLLQSQLHRLVASAYVALDRAEDSPKARRKVASSYKKKVDALLKTMIGAPPRRFKVDGKTYTPKTYREQYLKLADNDLQFVKLSHDPTRAFNRRYRDAYLGIGIPEGKTYNVSMAVLQGAVKKTLRKGVAVNVAVNVDVANPHRVAQRKGPGGKQKGVLSLKAFDYNAFVPGTKLTKQQRLLYGISLANHMMAITGHEPKKRGKQARWLIDNSHGTGNFRGGRFDMYDDFFKQYVDEVTVPRGMLSKALLKRIDSKPVIDPILGLSFGAGKTWTPQRKQELVQALIREEVTIDEASRRFKLPANKIKAWEDAARRAMLKALR